MTRDVDPDMGANRTGVGMSPIDSRAMEDAAGSAGRAALPDGHQFEQWRISYADDAESIPIGSVPPPATVKGVLKTGIQLVTGKQPLVFVDHMGARLAFERTGARLYEAMLAKTARGDSVMRSMLEQFHDQEVKHFQIVRESLDALGADPTAQTPAADVAGVISMGLVQVITDPRTNIDQCLQALLMAELGDNDGWAMLIRMAQRMGETDLVTRFTQAMNEEQFHLESVRSWLNDRTDAELQRAIPRH